VSAPPPDSGELHRQLLLQAAWAAVRHGPESVGPNVRATLEFRQWAPADAEAYAARVAAEAASWTADQLLGHYRASLAAQDGQAGAWAAADHYVPGAELAPELEFMRPLLEARLAGDVAARARSRWIDGEAARRLAELQAAAAAGDIPDRPGLALPEFLATATEEPLFEIPDLVPQGSRVIITGEEGAGKTTLCRYIAGCHAAGFHPFTGEPYDGGMSLILDCENPDGLQRMRLAELRESFHPEHAALMDRRLVADAQPGGIDLAAAWWQEYVLRMVDTWKITFAVISPLYKTCSLPPMGEEFFTAVSQFLDRLRSEHGCSLAIESHCRQPAAGQWARDPFPYGNSGWRRWPEAGMYLSRGGVLDEWRPNRFGQDVSWPGRLERVPGSQVLWRAAHGGGNGNQAPGGSKVEAVRAAVAANPGLSKRQLKAAAGDDGTGINEAVAAGAIICHPGGGRGRANHYTLNPGWAGERPPWNGGQGWAPQGGEGPWWE
jgi:hypothetical protein